MAFQVFKNLLKLIRTVALEEYRLLYHKVRNHCVLSVHFVDLYLLKSVLLQILALNLASLLSVLPNASTLAVRSRKITCLQPLQ